MARGWNAVKSMQITDRGKWIGWKDKTKCFRARQRPDTGTNLKKLPLSWCISYLRVKIDLRTFPVMNNKNNNQENNINWASKEKSEWPCLVVLCKWMEEFLLGNKRKNSL